MRKQFWWKGQILKIEMEILTLIMLFDPKKVNNSYFKKKIID